MTDASGAQFALAVHGGAGALPRERLGPERERTMRAALADSLRAGGRVLAGDGSALDAVVAAVVVLEDHPAFNAGIGSVLNAAGDVEMDASLMDGRDARAGAVAGVRALANPIRAARALLEEGRHVLLIGAGAESWAASRGLERIAPGRLITAARRAQLDRAREGNRVSRDHDEEGRGTVGAVARDVRGHLAAATSTGGMTNKREGRVGDSGVIGAGTWADDATAAVSGTGHGEVYIRGAFAHSIHARCALAGSDLEAACAAALDRVAVLGGSGGVIAIGPSGPPVLAHDTPAMFRGEVGPDAAPRVAIFRDEPLSAP